MVVVVVVVATAVGAVVAAPKPARLPPGSLIAPRQASGEKVALAKAEGHLHMSLQYEHLHQHP